MLDEMVVPAWARWLDVGSGVGSLSEIVVERCRPLTVVAIDPSRDFLALARLRVPQMTVVEAAAERLPFQRGSFDAVVSGLVLNLMVDPVTAVNDIERVTRSGGTVGFYLWDYDHPDFFQSRFWAGMEAVTGTRDVDDERAAGSCVRRPDYPNWSTDRRWKEADASGRRSVGSLTASPR